MSGRGHDRESRAGGVQARAVEPEAWALSGDDWAGLGGPVIGTGGTVCVDDPVGGAARFYRIGELGGQTNGAARHATIEISEVRMCWETARNLLYQVQYRSELSSNVWTDLGPARMATEPTTCDRFRIIDPGREYRLVGPDVVWVESGTFLMGSPENEPARMYYEGPQRTVTISRGFWMGKYEVTQGEYLEVMGSNPSRFQGANLPLEWVTWYDATNYCGLLTARERLAGRLPAGYEYRLPTEAQWEYACRAGTTTPFSFGSELRSGNAYVNFDGRCEYPPCGTDYYRCLNRLGTFVGRTMLVGSYAPNSWGLYDMHGNVWEWCLDWLEEYPAEPVIDPTGSPFGYYRVLRGGCWKVCGIHCRSAYRYGHLPEYWGDYQGLRIVLGLTQGSAGGSAPPRPAAPADAPDPGHPEKCSSAPHPAP